MKEIQWITLAALAAALAVSGASGSVFAQEFECNRQCLVNTMQQYLAALQTAATYTIQLDSMELRTAEDALAVTLVR